MTDLNYSFSDLEDQLDSTESGVSELLDDLEEDRSKVVEILEDLIGDVEDELDRVDEVYDSSSSKRREELENRLSLKMRKWDLERELEELKGIDSI